MPVEITRVDRSSRKTSKSSGKKSEALSLRLDPKMKFAVDFMSIIYERPNSWVVERAIKAFADNVDLSPEDSMVKETWAELWHISEGVRRINMIRHPRVRKGFEEEELLEFVKFHTEFFSQKHDLDELDSILVDILWPKIDEYLSLWRDRPKIGPWEAGKMMVIALKDAQIDTPDWPRNSLSPPEPITKTITSSGDLDDEIPF